MKEEIKSICIQIFQESQKTFAYHKKGIKKLKKLQWKYSIEFQEIFLFLLKKILIIFKREPTIERLVQFIIQFSTTIENDLDEEFCLFFIEFIFFLKKTLIF